MNKRLTSQTYTGDAVNAHVKALREAIKNREGKSMMQQVNVHVFSLALVLDRLQYLEEYYRLSESFRFSPADWREETEYDHD